MLKLSFVRTLPFHITRIKYKPSQNTEFVPKDRNIANVPELRPIEDFWVYLKQEVYKKDLKAILDPERIQTLGSGCYRRVDAARRHDIKNLNSFL